MRRARAQTVVGSVAAVAFTAVFTTFAQSPPRGGVATAAERGDWPTVLASLLMGTEHTTS
jgi:hypothetical protein